MIKGASLLARLTYVDQRDPEARERVLAALSPQDREVLGGLILSVGAYPFELNASLDLAIAKVFSPEVDPEDVFRESGRASASHNLASVHRQFVKESGPHDLLGRFPFVRRHYYSVAVALYHVVNNHHGRLEVRDAATVTPSRLHQHRWLLRTRSQAHRRQRGIRETQQMPPAWGCPLRARLPLGVTGSHGGRALRW